MVEYLRHAEILGEWDLRPKKIKRMGNEYKIKTQRGEKVLMVSYQEERIRFMHHVLEHLAFHGYSKGIPRLIPTKYGDYFVKGEMGIYYLTDWFGGKACTAKDGDQIIEMVRTLAEMHLAAQKVDQVPDSVVRERWYDLSEQMTRGVQKVNEKLGHLPEEFQQAWTTFASMAHRAQDLLRVSGFKTLVERAKREKTICHRQFRLKNIVITDHALSILGWEHCAYGVQVADLVYLMNKMMPKVAWDYTLGEQVIKAYHRIKPLADAEMMTLGAALMFPAAFVKFVEKYQDGRFEEDKIGRKFDQLMEQEEKKVAFLEAFFERYGLKGSYEGKNASLMSNAWYFIAPDDLKQYLKSGAQDVSCFLPFSFTVSPQGKLQEQFDMKICKISQEHQVPVIPVIYTPKQSKERKIISDVLADPACREKLIREIDRVLEIYAFPGVNIYFDLEDADDQEYFTVFMQSLAEEIRPQGKMLLATVAAAKGQHLYYDYAQLGSWCDYLLVEIMDENFGLPGPSASRQFVQAALIYAAAYVPREKIVAVLPVCGYRWRERNPVREPISFLEGQDLLTSQQGKWKRDPDSGVISGKITMDGRENEIWMEDAQSVFDKKFFVQQFGAAGCAFWRLGLEDPQLWKKEPVARINMEESFSEDEDDEEE